jgi:hypothetical protein
MDSNITSLHPRLLFFKTAGYPLDGENYLEPTCSNPYRIDWVPFKSSEKTCSIVNNPVLSVGLNNIRTNISDHKPLAAKICY